jgi:hypothetical protein
VSGCGGRVPRSTARMGHNIRLGNSEFETYPILVTHRLLDHCYQNAISASSRWKWKCRKSGMFVFPNIHVSLQIIVQMLIILQMEFWYLQFITYKFM